MREARFNGGKLDEWLEKNFTPAQRMRMWEAGDEESVIQQTGRTPGPNEGLNSLPPDERAVVENLQARAREAFLEAKALDMTQAEGLPSYMPRMVVEMTNNGAEYFGDNGDYGSGVGRNLRTSSPQLRKRKYLTVEETEAAAKAKLGEGAEVVRDIRTLALATNRLEQAIAGRVLINKVKQIGREVGQELVSEDKTLDTFTIDHPAFTRIVPKDYVTDPESGKRVPLRDQNGNVVTKKVPLYVSRSSRAR